MSSQDRSIARGSAPNQVEQTAKMSSQDRSMARGSAPNQVAKIANNEQPGSQHSAGICSKIVEKRDPGSQHSGGIGILGMGSDEYCPERAGPVGEYLGRGKDLFLYSLILDLRSDSGDMRSEI